MGEPISVKNMTSWKPVVKKTINVTGPLGTLNLEVPEYVHLEHDQENSMVSLKVEDANIVQQKQMWGK